MNTEVTSSVSNVLSGERCRVRWERCGERSHLHSVVSTRCWLLPSFFCPSLCTSPMLDRGTTLNSKEALTLKLQRRVGKFSLLFSMVQHWRDTFSTILSSGCWSWWVFFPNSPNSCSLSCLSCCLNLPTLTNFSLQLWGNVLDDLRRFTQYLSWQIRRWAGSPFPGFSNQENEALKALHSCSLLVSCRGWSEN